jgi:hypothetical protein
MSAQETKMKTIFASALLCGALLAAPAMAQNNSDPNAVGNAGGQFQGAQGGTPNANLSSTTAMNTTASPSSTNDAATAALAPVNRYHHRRHRDDDR